MLVIFLGALLAALTLSTLSSVSASPAHADEIGTEYDFTFSGNVTFDGEPLEGVLISAEGGGYKAEVETGADGKWKIGVPEKGTYTITLDEDTLPEGVVVAKGGSEIEAEFGLTQNKSVNFFLGEGTRATTGFFEQFVQRFVNGLNFGLLLALASIGLSLIFGTTGLSNFAHAEMITFGALMAMAFSVDIGLPVWIAIVIAIV
jgi:branched-chain amino acid transport system permease protein